MALSRFHSFGTRVRALPRTLVRSRLAWAFTLLLLVYTLGGFLLAPYLIQRYVPSAAQEHLGRSASVERVRLNPFTFTFEASGFTLNDSGNKVLLSFDRLFIDFDLSSVFGRAWSFADIRLERPVLGLEVDTNGRLNLLDVIERLRKPPRPDEAPPRVIVDHVLLDGGRVSFTDLSGAAPASTTVTPLNFELWNFGTVTDMEGRYSLDGKLPGGGTLAWKGDLSLEPIASSGEISLKGMKLETAWRFLRDELNLGSPRGELAIAGRYAFSYRDGKAALTVNEVQAELSDLFLALRDEKEPLVALRTVRLAQASFTLDKRELVLPTLLVADGSVNAAVSQDGVLDWQRMTPAGEPEQARVDAASTAPGSSPWQIRASDIALQKIALDYTDLSRKPAISLRTAALNGSLALDVTAGAAPARIVASEIDLELASPSMKTPDSDTPVVALEALTLEDGHVDTAERMFSAQSVTLSGGGLPIERGRTGVVGLLDVLAAKSIAPARSAAAAASTPPGNPWRYRIETVGLERFALGLADHSFKPVIGYDIEVTSLSAKSVDSASKKPIAFTAALRTAGGTLKSEGQIEQDFGGARARLALAQFPLQPLRPLLARHAALELKSGQLSGDARVSWRRDAKPALRARGEVRVDQLLVNEEQTNTRFVSWRSAVAEDIALTLSPDRLAIKLVRIIEPGARIDIAKDRTMNVTQVLRRDPQPERAAPKPAGRAAAEPPPFPYDIGAIRLEKGTLDFSDASLVLPFATQIQALQGSVVGVSSDPTDRAELRLSGQVDKYGEARASGALIPRDPEAFLDIRARFENIDMPLLSPYSATFAGRTVSSGKLSLVLDYKIVKGQLAGENQVVLRDFRLGERVKAPGALDLPLDMAVALLKDSEGKIDLAVPVRGNVGNPEFDYGKVIRSAIANAITRVVTAPFRALGNLFKGSAEEVRTVRFAPGSDRIAPAQREQLDALAKALKERPQLTLVVKGPYDPTRDARQLRRREARLDLARELGAKLDAGETPGPVAYGRADTQRALEALLAKRAGPDAMAALEKEYAKRTGKTPDRVNPLLGLFGRGSKDTAFYEAVFDRLAEAEPLPEGTVQTLAENRARAIVETLVKAGVEASRVQPGGITPVKSGEGVGITTELALAAR